MRYDTVLLDADETLFDFRKSEKEALTEALAELRIPPSDALAEAYSEINLSLWKALERREITKERLMVRRFELFLDRFFPQYDVSTAVLLSEHYKSRLSKKGYLLDGAGDFCRSLFGKARLYLVTNGVESIQRGRFAESGLAPYIEAVFVSEAIGCEKPQRAYFEYVSEHIPSFCRERTLMVGDSLSSDMRGGLGFGLDCCWYNPGKAELPREFLGQIAYTVSDYEELYRVITQGEKL